MNQIKERHRAVQKSVNLQYDTLGRMDDGPNESSTKRLIFQVLFLFFQKSFQYIF